MADYIPAAEVQFEAFVTNIAARVGQDPASLGVPEASAARLDAALTRYVEAARAAGNPTTRTKPAVLGRRRARAAAEAAVRAVVPLVRVHLRGAGRAAETLACLGLRPRSPVGRVPAPRARPILRAEADAGAVRVRLSRRPGEEAGPRSAFPAGARAAAVYVIRASAEEASGEVGPPPPDSPRWGQGFVTTTTRPRVPLAAGLTPGTPILVAARWLNGRGQAGPMSGAAGLYVPLANAAMA